MIYFKGFVWRIDADDGFPGGITVSFVEFPFITETETALLSAVRTESGSGDEITNFVSFDLNISSSRA